MDEAFALLNQALHAHRTATLDPYVSEVEVNRATAIRLGYGDGDRLAEGGWIDAKLLPQRPPRRRRVDQLRPQEHLAAILAGRRQVRPHETLILRARLDLDHNRLPEATLQARMAIDAMLSEAEGDAEGMAELQEMTVNEENVREAVETCERILRRQRMLSD